MEGKVFKRGNLEKQITALPAEVKFCKKCVISNQRPKITFDEDGVCSACKNANYKNKIDWDLREKELKDLLDQHRRKDGKWDVIVPSSGGKDSGFVAHQLKYKYGMNPLTVTWTPLIYTDIGFKNF
ncbi:MAG: N-acetyl sugar amidotransferase, partial [Leptospiraceae bacterium]|nr:N-acetyl sugar amidotransferase [Leptospiraceae bacterium]